MAAIHQPAARFGRLWSTRLWILSAILGATAIYSTVVTIHAGNQRGLALGLVTQATALHVSAVASARLERLALEGLAPAGPVAASTPDATTGRTTVNLLARRQREGVACACRDLLPVSSFFHVDPTSGRLTVANVDSATAAHVPPESTVVAIARDEAAAPRTVSNSSSHLIVDPRLGDQGMVALVQRDDRGTPVAVYGMVVDRRGTLAALFDRTPDRSAIASTGLTRLDSLSLEVRSRDSTPLFGVLGTGRARAIAHLGGPLRGLLLTIAVSPSGVAQPLLAPHGEIPLFHVGLLFAATVIVLALAFTMSRRELLLARARSDFIAGVSHDLRMPLAQILIAGETLAMERERNGTERVSLASSIVREARRLVALVDNVLLFSRSGALELAPVLRAVPVDELLDDVVDAVRLSVDDAGHTLETFGDRDVAVMADRRLVRQALVNLVDNAIKYGGEHQCIRLGVESRGPMVQLVVEDSGPGVPATERERIFEPYARLAADQVSERTGTGLGLSVVRQIIEASGGRVWMEDASRGGARVVIELRAAPAAEPATSGVA
jgi:signal transduction histidine kinase